MSRFLPTQSKELVPRRGGEIERKQYFFGNGARKGVPYKDSWDPDRAFAVGMQKVVWCYRAIDAICSNAARLPGMLREGDPISGERIPSELDYRLNAKANDAEGAYAWRYRLSSQILLNKRGAFIEKVSTRGGGIHGLYLLSPKSTVPIPDPDTFVSGYEVRANGVVQRILAPDDVIWIKKPHPFDPYDGITPLEAAGLTLEIDYYARMFNRNFLMNDGRPSGLLMVDGELTEDDAKELEARFSPIGGGPAMAGRTAVLEGDGKMSYIDTSASPRDAQHIESRKEAKEELLMAFGVPESVLGNASGRTYDNANAELAVFWRETMLPHLKIISSGLEVLDPNPDTFVGWDFSEVAVLGQDERSRNRFHLEELLAGAITADEYRAETRRGPMPDEIDNVAEGFMEGIARIAGADETLQETMLRITGGNQGHADNMMSALRRRFAANGGNIDEIFARLRQVPGLARSPEIYDPGQRAPRQDGRAVAAMKDAMTFSFDNYLDRQLNVIESKANGAKVSKLLAEGKGIRVSAVFNKKTWDQQICQEYDQVLSSICQHFDIEIDDETKTEFKLLFTNLNVQTNEFVTKAILSGGEDISAYYSDVLKPQVQTLVDDLVKKVVQNDD